MTEITNFDTESKNIHLETIEQQDMLIVILKQEILRLQMIAMEKERDKQEVQQKYETALSEIDNLKEKIESLKENNESIIQTFEVFQREFVKRDYKIELLTFPKKMSEVTMNGPFSFEFIRKIKEKFQEHEPVSKIENERSNLGEFYGYFFHEELDSSEYELYNESKYVNKLNPNKIKSWGKKNYFNENHRHLFWYNVLENELKITMPLYEHYLDILDSNRENEVKKTTIIDLDLRRMDLKIDESKSETMKVKIKQLLELFELYRPDVGYVQGMSYLAWMLLIRMEGYQAFTCFSNMILCDPFIESLYLFKGENIKKIVDFFEECLKDKKSKLYKHLKNMQVESELFIIEWAFTLFSRAFSLRISSEFCIYFRKIWDLWYCEGFHVFFKVTMVVFDMLEAEILELKENDKIIDLIRNQTHLLNETEFLKNLQKQRLFQDLIF